MIRSYLGRMLPVLHEWSASGIGSLREITPQHVTKAVTKLRGGPRKSLATALRSLFRALKQERVIFRTPRSNWSSATPSSYPPRYRPQSWPDSSSRPQRLTGGS